MSLNFLQRIWGRHIYALQLQTMDPADQSCPVQVLCCERLRASVLPLPLSCLSGAHQRQFK